MAFMMKLTNDLSWVCPKRFSCIDAVTAESSSLLLHFWWMMEAKKPFSGSSLKGSSSFVAVGTRAFSSFYQKDAKEQKGVADNRHGQAE